MTARSGADGAYRMPGRAGVASRRRTVPSGRFRPRAHLAQSLLTGSFSRGQWISIRGVPLSSVTSTFALGARNDGACFTKKLAPCGRQLAERARVVGRLTQGAGHEVPVGGERAVEGGKAFVERPGAVLREPVDEVELRRGAAQWSSRFRRP
jgi:hypothetical protein